MQLEPSPPHTRLVDNLVNQTPSQTVFFNATETSKWQKQDENLRCMGFYIFYYYFMENFSVTLWLCACTGVLPNANRRLPSGRVAVYHLETVCCWRHELPHPPVVEVESLLR